MSQIANVATDAYGRAFAALPRALREARSGAYARFERERFPGKRIEDWHYTDLSALNERDFAAAPAAEAPAVDALADAELLHFVNGRRIGGPARSDEAGSGLADDGVTALNAALYRDGADLEVSGSTPRRIHLYSWIGSGTKPAMVHLRHRVVLRRGSQATLFLDLHGDDSELLNTQVAEIEVEAGAHLTLVRLQSLGKASTDIARTEIRLGRDAQLRYLGVDLGGALARHDLNVQLAETGAEAHLNGIFAPADRTHADTHTRIIHAVPNTISRELYRGLVMDRAHAVFNGRIVVQPGAQKTDSEQHVACLLLSPRAEVNAKPELEIYADDVKCAHGSSCGQLDEQSIYYLRTRGLDPEAARTLLTYTFAYDALGTLADEPLRRRLGLALLSRLPNGHALEELLV
ncbi:Fe-S cluster assembly protein SufD [Algiphilus sp. W345]|uniref:Fe-S cluster assembly protein SufD n=1 Tax=Banduia mediterranea TaxID=3075609 RepID=A0ABU2WMR0_9GAMM|nr:Fe-S cluster assembly protein SufD [Algiphilus sp. W345]MDT0499161.1 Fe-S cluster assembly protein SufD [Algiphilus sp. W345]